MNADISERRGAIWGGRSTAGEIEQRGTSHNTFKEQKIASREKTPGGKRYIGSSKKRRDGLLLAIIGKGQGGLTLGGKRGHVISGSPLQRKTHLWEGERSGVRGYNQTDSLKIRRKPSHSLFYQGEKPNRRKLNQDKAVLWGEPLKGNLERHLQFVLPWTHGKRGKETAWA